MRAPDIVPQLPTGSELEALLELGVSAEVGDLLLRTLIEPLNDLISRPRKELRAEVVAIGLKLARLESSGLNAPADTAVQTAAEIIELIHMGSLIVDDIQDQSEVRRGHLALHRVYGVPVALNAGNWLYFWPLKKLRELPLPEAGRLAVYEECHSTLLRAHFGQALDVGVGIDQIARVRVEQVCLAAMELKSGALMSLALKLGAFAAGSLPSPSLLARLNALGHQLGIVLQMYDDLGNLVSSNNPAKRFEDLRRRCPGFVWAAAARFFDDVSYSRFVDLVRALPESQDDLARTLSDTGLPKIGRMYASAHWRRSWMAMREQLPSEIHSDIEELMERLMGSYD